MKTSKTSRFKNLTGIHIDIRLRPGIATSFIAVAARCSLHLSASRPLRPNVTSSIKPEVHNVAQRRRRRTEPRPQGTCIQNFVKIGPAVPEICSRTDRQTDTQTQRRTDRPVDHNTPHPCRGGVNMQQTKPQCSFTVSTTYLIQ